MALRAYRVSFGAGTVEFGGHKRPPSAFGNGILAPAYFGDRIVFWGRTSPGVALLSWEFPGIFLRTKLVREFDSVVPETPFALPDERSQIIAKNFSDFSNAIFFFGK